VETKGCQEENGMIRPTIGYIWNKSTKALSTEEGRISFAHSDLNGISLFEEAQYHGVERAKKLLQWCEHKNV